MSEDTMEKLRLQVNQMGRTLNKMAKVINKQNERISALENKLKTSREDQKMSDLLKKVGLV